MNLKETAEKIVGRNLLFEDGIKQFSILSQEKRLNIEIPSILKELYTEVGNNELFADGFHHLAEITELFVKDNKLVFLK